MGWKISVIENTAKVPLDAREGVARQIIKLKPFYYTERCYKAYEETFADTADTAKVIDLVFGKRWGDDPEPDTILFDPDNQEHMDHVTRSPEICVILAASGAVGRILFGSLEGDNRGKFWGVEFASGHYRKYSATTDNIRWNIEDDDQ